MAAVTEAHAQQPPSAVPNAAAAPAPQPVDSKTVLLLVRSHLLALDQANKTGNYSVLRELGSSSFQRANTSARLSEVFAAPRKAGLDLADVAVLDPIISVPPRPEPDGLLHIAGYFPSDSKSRLAFEMFLRTIDNRWALEGISVRLMAATGSFDAKTQGSSQNSATQPEAAKRKPQPKPDPRATPAP